MTDGRFRLLPEGVSADDFVDCADFIVVTGHGEIYTLFRIVRVTHVATDLDQTWTHLVNVVRSSDHAIGVGRLRVEDRVIVDAEVDLAPLP